ncbi:MAG: DUF4345 domain-containing protein [Myxococcota bacterium]|nr:DUF4345 domain-containing protein [Myxococcota bacterium]
MQQQLVVLLWFSALAFGAIGVFFLAVPERAAASIGVELTNATARTDVPATYGGMVLGVACFFAWAALAKGMLRPGAWSMALVYGGLALGRVIQIARGERPEPMIWWFLAIELVVTVWAAVALTRLDDS